MWNISRFGGLVFGENSIINDRKSCFAEFTAGSLSTRELLNKRRRALFGLTANVVIGVQRRSVGDLTHHTVASLECVWIVSDISYRGSFQWAGAFVLLLVSAWFVDMFIMLARAVHFLRRRLLQGTRNGNGKLAFPLWVFPLLWLVTFVVFVSVASVHGERDPVIRRVEVSNTGARRHVFM